MVENLPEARYRFVEITPPEGFELPTGYDVYHEFIINEESGVETAVVITAENTRIPPSIDLLIQKIDGHTNEKLADANFFIVS